MLITQMLKILPSLTFYPRLLVTVLFIATLPFNTFAEEKEIYKKTNKAGVVEFTDIPNHDTKPIRVPPMNTYKQKPLPRKSAAKKSTALTAGYKDFTIVSPLSGKEVRENSGIVAVQLSLSPTLKPGHTVKVMLDNDEKSALTGKLLVYRFTNISRGTHKLQAFILNAKQDVLQESAIIEFHLKRFIFTPPAPKPK